MFIAGKLQDGCVVYLTADVDVSNGTYIAGHKCVFKHRAYDGWGTDLSGYRLACASTGAEFEVVSRSQFCRRVTDLTVKES